MTIRGRLRFHAWVRTRIRSRRTGSRGSHRQHVVRTHWPRWEVLESRCLLDAGGIVVDTAAREVVITGTPTDDVAHVNDLGAGTIEVWIRTDADTERVFFAQTTVDRVVFRGDAGNDVFRNMTSLASHASGGLGDDELQGGSTGDRMFGDEGDDFILGHSGNDVLLGGSGNDTVRGGPGVDSINGGSGNDTLEGDEGPDEIWGARGEDTLRGGDGNDLLHGGDGNDSLNGQDGDDVLNGNAGDDDIWGAAGRDVARGQAGDDSIEGGDGADALYGDEGSDLLEGGRGGDELFGGSGDDFLYGFDGNDDLWGGDGNDLLVGQQGRDVLNGYRGNDEIWGGDGDDLLLGFTGDDLLRGGPGNDRLFGDEGIDVLDGDEDNDRLWGGNGADTLRGGDGDDELYGGLGDDSLTGQDGNDQLFGSYGVDLLLGGNGDDLLRGASEDDRLVGGFGDDVLYGDADNDLLEGSAGRDRLIGGLGDDTLLGFDGNDTLQGSSGNDLLQGMEGDDIVMGDSGTDELWGGTGLDVLVGGVGDDVLRGDAGIDLLFGQDGDDSLYGDAGDDRIEGGNGDDLLRGGPGNDEIRGEAGDDTVTGEEDDDTIYGGDGDDLLFGNEGNDIIFGEADDDSIYGGDANDMLFGASGNDLISGSNGDDYLDGGDGDDEVLGGYGSDSVVGGAGDDTVFGDAGNDIIFGEDGEDSLYGDEGDDEIDGGAGDDLLRGGSGNDQIDGGADNDTVTGEEDDDTIYGGDGADSLWGNDGNDSLFGESGDDMAYGGNGDDAVHGNDGNDLVVGSSGNDFLHGGSGDDDLEGLAGNDILIGHDGDDTLLGHSGEDIAIGGSGQDTLSGDEGSDILIGASTTYDDSQAALNSIQGIWSLSMSEAHRAVLLTDASYAYPLLVDETVPDDGVIDDLSGNEDVDWFFVTGGVPSEESHHSHDHAAPPPGAPGSTARAVEMLDTIDFIRDWEAGEDVASNIPHPENPVLRQEHFALFDLVDYVDVTDTAIASGVWSNPAIWASQSVPAANANVLIPDEFTVTVDGHFTAALQTLRVDGHLEFDPFQSTSLHVDTLNVAPSGTLTMGTATQPIAATATARIVVEDRGPIDRTRDPFALGRGVSVHGTASIHGTPTTSHIALAVPPTAGATELVLASVPVNWKVGDRIALAGAHANQTEELAILGIAGNRVTVTPLQFDHLPPDSSLEIHVAHLTRNAIIESANSAIDRRGHVMFMHTRAVDIGYAAFYNLGRSDKQKIVNDPFVDSQNQLVPGTGLNPRARYALHFHRNGVTDDGNPSRVIGSVVQGSPGWGFVNHSSFVHFVDNVAYDVDGAGFVAEAGDEIGLMQGNIALKSNGSGESMVSRIFVNDFGHQGDGFWLQGPGIEVIDNIAADQSGQGFVFYTDGISQMGLGITEFQAANLADPSLANGDPTIRVRHAPLAGFRSNTAYANSIGAMLRHHLQDAGHSAGSVVEDLRLWHNDIGMQLNYSEEITLRNVDIWGDAQALSRFGLTVNHQTRDVTYENMRVYDHRVGIEIALGGRGIVNGGEFRNVENIVIGTAVSTDRVVVLSGNIDLQSPTSPVAQNLTHYDIVAAADFAPFRNRIDHVFARDLILLETQTFANSQLFFAEQAADFVPFPAASAYVPTEYIGKTNAELLQEFGLTVGGLIAPEDAVPLTGVRGLVGDRTDS